jgi:signal peptidase I
VGAFAIARLLFTVAPLAGFGVGSIGTIPADRSIVVRVREYLDALLVAGLLALFLTTFVVRMFYIPSQSMVPTLREHDVLLVNEFAYRFGAPQRGDIAVFTPPVQSASSFIKRVIGVPGDTLRVSGGRVFVNGKALLERYIAAPPAYRLVIKNYTVYVDMGSGLEPLDSSQAAIPPRSMWQAPDRIPRGFYFMMGDNRNDSDDSHIWGFATSASITGKAFFLMWPLNRLHVLK